MLEDLRSFLRWVQSRHAPLGRFSPLAASVLFAAAGFTHSPPLKFVAYVAASALVLLIALDLASGLMESSSDDGPDQPSNQRVPVTPFQFVLTGIQGSLYTFLIFMGFGPFTPIIFIVPVFGLACLAAWRNVRLWYRQGAEFEDRLREVNAEEADRLARQALQKEHQPRPT